MVSLLLSLLLALAPLQDVAFEVRAKDNLILGKGAQSGSTYYDVPITRQAPSGVLIKLPYTKKGGKLSFDLHHRVSLTPDFKLAEVTTIIEIITGGTASIGTYTISDNIDPADKFAESIVKSAAAARDPFVTPMASKTITIDIRPGPQSISFVGQTQIVRRGTSTSRIDTPNARIAAISNLKFEEITEKNPLKKSPL